MAIPRSLETNVMYLCGKLTHQLHRALTTAFRKNGIRVTVEQFSILALLFYNEGINQQEISARLNRDKTTVARVLSNMERTRMIMRTPDKMDTRGKLIFLTKKGRSIQQRAIAHSGTLYIKAVAGSGKRAMTDTVQLLTRFIRNINETT